MNLQQMSKISAEAKNSADSCVNLFYQTILSLDLYFYRIEPGPIWYTIRIVIYGKK